MASDAIRVAQRAEALLRGEALAAVNLVDVHGAVSVLGLDVPDGVFVSVVSEFLVANGLEPARRQVDHQPLWCVAALVREGDRIRAAWAQLRPMGMDVTRLASVMREVLEACAAPVLERSMSRHMGSALDDVDGRLDKLLEQGQGLFRQQGENGQRMRDVLNACSTLTGELRASNAAVKKDVTVLLAKFEKQTEVLMQSVAAELDAVRRSLNELAKAAK